MSKKIKFVCPDCGSDDVSRDAYAVWNIETQKWELEGMYDAMQCNEPTCGYSDKTGFSAVEITDED